jgi:hypothetical protein
MGFKNVAVIVAPGTVIKGKRVTKQDSVNAADMISSGKADAALLSILIGGAGLNCQTMDTVVFMAPCTSNAKQVQALGKFSRIVS